MMVVGTSSHAGKSWMATAICRCLRRRGVHVAPFKAQNMSLNSYPCRGGGEIGRSQAAQAEACGLDPTSDMNPILLKPTSDGSCQVIVNGKIWRQVSSREHYRHYDFLLQQVLAAYQRLAGEFEFIVMEGAGGAAEINLRKTDLVNLPLAVRVKAPALLVADIDRGGLFASVVGTFALLEPDEKELVRSFAVNRFRGDPSFFASGRAMLEQRVERRCLGVFPYQDDVWLDPEDSVSLEEASVEQPPDAQLRVVIIRLPHISNFTDFRLLPGASYISKPVSGDVDCIILPGSKNTIADLQWLRRTGLDAWILNRYSEGADVWGICGGYQMLGRAVSDPDGVESAEVEARGLGLLPIETIMLAEKTTRVVEARLAESDVPFQAYEIHMGKTAPHAGDVPFAIVDGKPEGHRRDRVIGTYLHGALEYPDVLRSLLAQVAERRGKEIPAISSRISKDEHYDRLADWFERHADRELFEELYLA